MPSAKLQSGLLIGLSLAVRFSNLRLVKGAHLADLLQGVHLVGHIVQELVAG